MYGYESNISRIVGSEVPLCHLHPYHDLFALPPQVFGGVDFVHDHTPTTSKLEPALSNGCLSANRACKKAIEPIF